MPESQYSQVPNYAPVNTEVAALDYSFLQSALSTKEKQYEAGQSQVKSLYNSVLHSQLTNPENIQERDKYVQEANRSMQALSKADLSLPKNMGEAQKVFAPFWEDVDIVADIYNTKKGQSELQTLQSWEMSTDDKVREQYSPDSVQDVQFSIDKIKEAKRGDGSLQNIRIQKATPVKDLVRYLDDEAKKDNFEVSWNELDGPYLIDHKNGKNAAPNFYSYAKSKIGDQFTNQFAMYGRLAKERLVRENMQLGLTRKDAEEVIAKDLYPEVVKPYVNNYNKLLLVDADNENRLNTTLKGIQDKESKGLTMTPEEIAALDFLNKNKLTYNSQLSELKNKLIDFAAPATFEKFKNNSENFLANSHKEQFLTDWATGASANESVKYSANTGWYNAEHLKIQQRTLEETQRFHNMEDKWHRMADAISWADLQLKYGTTKKDGSVVSDSGELSSGGDPYEKAVNYYKGLKDDVGVMYFSPTGMAQILTDLPTKTGIPITSQDITNFNTYLSEQLKGNKIKSTPAIQGSFAKISEALKAKGVKVDPRQDFVTQWQSALTNYAQIYVQENRYPNGNDQTRDKAITIATLYDQIDKNTRAVETFNQEHEKNIQTLIQGSSYKNNPLVVGEGSGRHIITGAEAAAKIGLRGNIELRSVDGNQSNLSIKPEDFTKAYIAGKVEFNKMLGTVTVDGQTYSTASVDLMNGMPLMTVRTTARYNQPAISIQEKLEDTFGKSQDAGKIYTDLIKKTLPQKDFWENNSGKMGIIKEFGFEKGDIGKDLLPEITSHNNWAAVYTEPNGGSPLSEEQKVAFERLGSLPNAEEYFSKPRISTTSQSGSPVAIVSVSNNVKDAKYNPDVEALKGVQVYVEMKPEARTTAWKSLEPLMRGYRMHPELAEGKPITANSLDKSFGLDYMIMADDLNNPQGYTTTLNYQYLNPKTGKYEPKEESQYTTFNQQSVDKALENLNKVRAQIYSTNKNNANKRVQTSGTGMTLEQYNLSRGIK